MYGMQMVAIREVGEVGDQNGEVGDQNEEVGDQNEAMMRLGRRRSEQRPVTVWPLLITWPMPVCLTWYRECCDMQWLLITEDEVPDTSLEVPDEGMRLSVGSSWQSRSKGTRRVTWTASWRRTTAPASRHRARDRGHREHSDHPQRGRGQTSSHLLWTQTSDFGLWTQACQ